MKGLLVFAALVAVASAWGKWDPGFKVRFDVGLGVGRSFFISLPETVNEAKRSRWVQTTRVEGQHMQSLLLFTPSIDDVVVGTFYDDTGYIAGLQIALPQDSFTGGILDWKTQGFSEWTAPANSKGVERKYWVTAQYFVSPATLARSPAERIATRAINARQGRVLQEDYIYVTGYDGELMPISTDARKVADTENTGFNRQACMPFMGRHYYHNTTKNSECKSDTLFPWFALLDQSYGVNQLIGTGFVTFGQLPVKSLVRDYFERPSRLAVKLIVPDGPSCLYDLADDVGLVTMHIYYINSPLQIQCFTT